MKGGFLAGRSGKVLAMIVGTLVGAIPLWGADTLVLETHGEELFVVLSVDTAGSEAPSFVVKDGGTAIYHDLQTTEAWGITPRVVDADSGDVELHISRLDRQSLTTGPVAPGEGDWAVTLHGKVGFAEHLPSELPMVLRIQEVRRAPAEKAGFSSSSCEGKPGAARVANPDFVFSRDDNCCIVCNGVMYCGCAVSSSCGSCCSGCC